MLTRTVNVTAALIVAAFLIACAPLIADYSLEAYKNATSLKAEVLALVDKSAEKFSVHKKDVESTTTRINAAYEFAAGQAKNEIVAGQWALLRDPQGPLYGGVISTWRAQTTLSPAYREEKKRQLSDAFDSIICVESNKQASNPCTRVPTEAGDTSKKGSGS
jgi:hypothetical protein